MTIGIEKLTVYAGRLRLDIPDLVAARDALDAAYVQTQLMCEQRSVYPPFEDAVTLAVNAAKAILTPEDLESIALLIVGTESAVDCGKPVSTWVHRLCGLKANCRNFEVKHACYGTTGALKMASAWLATQNDPTKKALIINSDLSRKFLNTPYEPTGGGCAVAMLVSQTPEILEFDLNRVGYWTSEISDTFRPTSKTEIFNGQISLYSYLDALDGAYQHYEKTIGSVDYDAAFKKHIYHAPFPGMPLQAHRNQLSGLGLSKKAAIANFEQKVSDSLVFAKRIGMAYGGSTFLNLLSLLNTAEDLQAGDEISIFAYGSGCQGEFYSGTIGENAIAQVRSLNLENTLAARHLLTVEDYENLELLREQSIDAQTWQREHPLIDKVYAAAYDGQELLVLESVQDYQRSYQWS
ncbi:MAG: hydroxymethylglutaryl-CoA synthase family protein [Spirulina sp. SIO3F2]|nr:hydroxymethylglutaryl-CoA synthase family protein [Spirulina sp. SIO3F2]